MHSSYANQAIVLKVADRRTDRRTDTPGDENRYPPKFWLRAKKPRARLWELPRRLYIYITSLELLYLKEETVTVQKKVDKKPFYNSNILNIVSYK